jgi:hypothetical protein
VNDLNRIISGAFPDTHRPISFESTDDPLMFWDILVWWRELSLRPVEKEKLLRYIITDLVVPSDGLWAGIGLNSLVRVWKNICRSVGYLFRFNAENYLGLTFRSIEDYHVSSHETREAQIDVVLFLIKEALLRINGRAYKAWQDFMYLDKTDLIGSVSTNILKASLFDSYGITEIVDSEVGSKIYSRSMSMDDDGESSSESRTLFVEILDMMADTHFKTTQNIGVFPGNRNPKKTLFDYMRNMFEPADRTKLTRPSELKFLRSPVVKSQSCQLIKILIKHYLDIEQWRGQFFAAVIESDKFD